MFRIKDYIEANIFTWSYASSIKAKSAKSKKGKKKKTETTTFTKLQEV